MNETKPPILPLHEGSMVYDNHHEGFRYGLRRAIDYGLKSFMFKGQGYRVMAGDEVVDSNTCVVCGQVSDSDEKISIVVLLSLQPEFFGRNVEEMHKLSIFVTPQKFTPENIGEQFP